MNEIGVTIAGLWPCIFCRLIVALRNGNFRGTECGHYASLWVDDLISEGSYRMIYVVAGKYDGKEYAKAISE